MYCFHRTIIPGLVDTHLAVLDPKPHLYTFFTFKTPEGGGSFTAGIAWRGTACYGHLTELYGDNVASYYHQESLRTSVSMYPGGNFGDLDVAGVTGYLLYSIISSTLNLNILNICRPLLMNLAII